MRPIRSNSYCRAMTSPIIIKEKAIPSDGPEKESIELSTICANTPVVKEQPKSSANSLESHSSDFKVNVVIRNSASKSDSLKSFGAVTQTINSVNDRDSNYVNTSEQQLIANSSHSDEEDCCDQCYGCLCICWTNSFDS